MRGILFALSFVLFVVGCMFGVDGAIAGTGASTAVLGWGWFAAALVTLVLAPDRGISRDLEIEQAFVLAAQETEEEALAAWPVWEGFVLPSLSTDEAAVRFVSDGIELCDELLVARSNGVARVTDRQAKSIAQQRAIAGELARKDLTSAEVFDLGLALMRAKKGLLV